MSLVWSFIVFGLRAALTIGTGFVASELLLAFLGIEGPILSAGLTIWFTVGAFWLLASRSGWYQ